jgi:hypothetical protein
MSAEIDAARLLLERLGLTAEDLVEDSPTQGPVPTFAEYIPSVSAAMSEGTRRAYQSYWQRIVQQWGDRRLDEPTASDIQHLAEHIKTRAVRRRNGRGGRSATEHLISSLRCVYNHAVADGLIPETRYDSLWKRVGEHLPWVVSQGISTHWLRHTALTWVERNFGYAVARAYAGHTGGHDVGSTATYIRADLHEVATALAALTGEAHPLAH